MIFWEKMGKNGSKVRLQQIDAFHFSDFLHEVTTAKSLKLDGLILRKLFFV